ncbi:MAG: S1C family serine protease [Lawsonibacter sp.]
MDNRTDDLWTGGPWEQPTPVFSTPPALAISARTQAQPRPVLRPRGKRRFHWPTFAALAALVLVLCLLAVLLNSLSQNLSFSLPDLPSNSQPAQTQDYSAEPPSIPHAATGGGITMALMPSAEQALTYTQIYEKNASSMVSIEAETQEEYSTGTGVILTEDGYIVTNAHVVAGAEYVRVIFSNNDILDAQLAGFNADEDLAVLKVDASGLTPAEFGDSSDLRCGDPVAAIGDPLGYRSTITDGIVSALDREVDVDGITMVLIQTSAAINFGNSGGALINQYGQVVGITTIKIVTDDGSAEALGFAIPSQRVKYVVDALIDGREIQTGVFGFTVLTRPVSGGGLELESVHPNSDAYLKGLRAGDIIVAANGQSITGTQDLARLKLSLGPGDLVTLTYLRDGVSYTVDVALVTSDQVS